MAVKVVLNLETCRSRIRTLPPPDAKSSQRQRTLGFGERKKKSTKREKSLRSYLAQ